MNGPSGNNWEERRWEERQVYNKTAYRPERRGPKTRGYGPQDVINSLLDKYLPKGFTRSTETPEGMYGSIKAGFSVNSEGKYASKKGHYLPRTRSLNTIEFRLKKRDGHHVVVPIDIMYDIESADYEALGVLMNLHKYLLRSGNKYDLYLKPQDLFVVRPSGIVIHDFMNADYFNYSGHLNDVVKYYIKYTFMPVAQEKGIIQNVERRHINIQDGTIVYDTLFELISDMFKNKISETQIMEFLDWVAQGIVAFRNDAHSKGKRFNEAQKIRIMNAIAIELLNDWRGASKASSSSSSSNAYGAGSEANAARGAGSSSSSSAAAVDPYQSNIEEVKAYAASIGVPLEMNNSAIRQGLLNHGKDGLVEQITAHLEQQRSSSGNASGAGSAAGSNVAKVRQFAESYGIPLEMTNDDIQAALSTYGKKGLFEQIAAYSSSSNSGSSSNPNNVNMAGGRTRRGTRKGRKARRLSRKMSKARFSARRGRN